MNKRDSLLLVLSILFLLTSFVGTYMILKSKTLGTVLSVQDESCDAVQVDWITEVKDINEVCDYIPYKVKIHQNIPLERINVELHYLDYPDWGWTNAPKSTLEFDSTAGITTVGGTVRDLVGCIVPGRHRLDIRWFTPSKACKVSSTFNAIPDSYPKSFD